MMLRLRIKMEIFKGKLISYDHGYDEEPEVDYDSLEIQIYK